MSRTGSSDTSWHSLMREIARIDLVSPSGSLFVFAHALPAQFRGESVVRTIQNSHRANDRGSGRSQEIRQTDVWLASARETLLADFKSILRERLRISSVEIESLAHLEANRLDLSISQLSEGLVRRRPTRGRSAEPRSLTLTA